MKGVVMVTLSRGSLGSTLQCLGNFLCSLVLNLQQRCLHFLLFELLAFGNMDLCLETVKRGGEGKWVRRHVDEIGRSAHTVAASTGERERKPRQNRKTRPGRRRTSGLRCEAGTWVLRKKDESERRRGGRVI